MSTHLVPVRITPDDDVFVDAWGPETPIVFHRSRMPTNVNQRLDDTGNDVITEARVDPADVILAITTVLDVPQDSELFTEMKD